MKPFRFALAAVLDVRTRAEEDARVPFLEATRRYDAALSRAARSRECLTTASRAFASSATGAAGADLRETLVEIEVVAAALARCEEVAREAAERAAATRAAFLVARRERRQIELLRDRARAAFDGACERDENGALDEANGARHNAATLSASSFHNSYVS